MLRSNLVPKSVKADGRLPVVFVRGTMLLSVLLSSVAFNIQAAEQSVDPVRQLTVDSPPSDQTSSDPGTTSQSSTSQSSAIPLSAWGWLLARRQQVSRRVAQLGRDLDDWLAGEGVAEQLNETYLSVRFNQLYGTLDHYNSKVRVGGRLDLPTVSERWKLIFESDIQELNTLQENVLDETNSGDSIGGIRYQDETDSGWSLSHDVGVRSVAPLDPFYRFRARYSLPLGDVWSAGIDQKIWYYDSRGWGLDSRVTFTRELGVDRFIRLASEANFQDDRGTTQFSQTAALYRTLGPDETLGYELGLLGINKPNVQINDYYVQMPYRRAIYEDWLFLEVSPQVLVSRVEDWRPQPRLLVNLEMLFFDF